jgi:F-type H+-transporting ATPase subunit c
MLSMLAVVQEGMQAAVGTTVGAGLAVVGAGIAIIGAGIGIGRIGGQMTEAMARQPEAAAQIQTGAIILAALIEGVALFALVIAGFIK